MLGFRYGTKLINLLKVLLVLFMVVYIVYYLEIDFGEVFVQLYSFSLSYVIVFFFLMLFIEYIQGFIVGSLLAPHGIYLTNYYIYKVNFISMFYYTFMPFGTVTGGAIRWYRLYEPNNRKREVFTVIILQNVLQLFFFALLAVFVFTYNNPLDRSYHFISYIFSFLMTFVIILFLLVLMSGNIQNYLYMRLFGPLFNSLPRVVGEKFILLWETLVEYSKEPKAISKGFLYTVIYKGSQLLFYYFIALKLGIVMSFFEVCSLFIASSFLFYMPLPLSGLGARELLFISLCAYYGVGKEEALLYSLTIFSFTILLAIFGGFIEITERIKGIG